MITMLRVVTMLRGVRRVALRRLATGEPRDAGHVTLFVAILSVGVLLVISMVYFQGLQLRAGREAGNLAEEAARAGAGQLDRDRAYRTGVSVVDPSAAVVQARAYLAAAGATGTATAVGTRQVRVTVTITRPAPILSIIGIGSVSVTRTATADLVVGVEGAQTP
jgi:hypothetical protein